LSLLGHAWGFLAVFFAAVALRQTELKLAAAGRDDPERPQIDKTREQTSSAYSPANPSANSAARTDELPPTVSGGSLIFKEHLERLSEMLLILLVGGMMFSDSWSWRAVALAVFLFLVARPVSALAGLLGTRTSWPIRGMVSWFGVRGIGSLYYLMYAIQHGLPEALALELIQLTLIVVTLSILAHGISVKPMMSRFWRHRKNLPHHE
jgi:hypothetical protein